MINEFRFFSNSQQFSLYLLKLWQARRSAYRERKNVRARRAYCFKKHVLPFAMHVVRKLPGLSLNNIFTAEFYNHRRPMVPRQTRFDSPETLCHVIEGV
jgi:hypothetical protein